MQTTKLHLCCTRLQPGMNLYLLWCGHLEPSGIYPTGCFRLHRVLVSRVTGRVLNYGRVLSHGFRGAGDGRFRWQAHLVVQGFVQFLVSVGPALCVGVLVIRGMATVCAVHGVFATRRRQVGQAVIVNIQVVFRCAVGLSVGEKRSFQTDGKKKVIGIRGMSLTLPSETHTSWFCCCWMVSFRAPYQPSFILFKLMVAEENMFWGGSQLHIKSRTLHQLYS